MVNYTGPSPTATATLLTFTTPHDWLFGMIGACLAIAYLVRTMLQGARYIYTLNERDRAYTAYVAHPHDTQETELARDLLEPLGFEVLHQEPRTPAPLEYCGIYIVFINDEATPFDFTAYLEFCRALKAERRVYVVSWYRLFDMRTRFPDFPLLLHAKVLHYYRMDEVAEDARRWRMQRCQVLDDQVLG